MSLCDTIQNRLADEGLAIVDSDADVRRHVATCADCARVLRDLRRLDATLADLPAPDAPDALVARTLQAVRRAASPAAAPAPSRYARHHLAAGLAASVVVIASFTLSFTLLESSRPLLGIGTEQFTSSGGFDFTRTLSRAKDLIAAGSGAQHAEPAQRPRRAGAPVVTQAPPVAAGDALADLKGDYRPTERKAAEDPAPGNFEPRSGERRPRSDEPSLYSQLLADNQTPATDADGRTETESQFLALLKNELQAKEQSGADELTRPLSNERRTTRGERDEEQLQRRRAISGRQATSALSAIMKSTGEKSEQSAFADQRSAEAPRSETEVLTPPASKSKKKANPDRRPRSVAEESHANTPRLPAEVLALGESRDNNLPTNEPARAPSVGATAGAAARSPLPQSAPVAASVAPNGLAGGKRAGAEAIYAARARARAQNFLQRYQSLDGLSFQAASGYWSNSYLPGDPRMRLFQARLNDWNRAGLGSNARLEKAVAPVRQPFDAPQNAAVALYLDSDTPAITGPTRLRVQVGLKGAERQGGHRPAMNISLVLDLRNAPDSRASAQMRALISALARARQPEDRFSLVVAGPDGGLLVPAKQFRHGPLQVAMARTLGAPHRAGSRVTALREALVLATQSVREDDDTKGVLGSSLVLLVTASSMSSDLATLERLVHRNAVAGIALSVVSLGGNNNLDHVDRLVAAGQGSRRILDSAQAADALVDAETHSASRAIARALRLRIRLAPGVKLIDVLGSHRLTAPDAERVREAEQAIDQRLARNLGIRADRGEDEEGIQIVIPNFYAGDTHVILLDVLAQGAGTIADVTLRYKDVVYLRNGVAHANLTIDNNPATRSPLQGNVLKNLMAFEFAGQIRAVSRDLAGKNARRAALRLARLRDLLHGLRLEVRGWQSDPDLIADEALLKTYISVLNTPLVGDVAQRRHLVDSLHYAAFRKLQPRVPLRGGSSIRTEP